MMMLLMIFSHPFPMFLFHFVKLNLLIRREERGDLLVCLPNPLMHTSGGLAANRVVISPRERQPLIRAWSRLPFDGK